MYNAEVIRLIASVLFDVLGVYEANSLREKNNFSVMGGRKRGREEKRKISVARQTDSVQRQSDLHSTTATYRPSFLCSKTTSVFGTYYFNSLPHLNYSIPSTSKHSRSLHRLPNSSNTWPLIMSMILLQHSRSLEVPKEQLSVTVTTANESTIGTYCNVTCISGCIVSLHLLLTLQGKSISSLID